MAKESVREEFYPVGGASLRLLPLFGPENPIYIFQVVPRNSSPSECGTNWKKM